MALKRHKIGLNFTPAFYRRKRIRMAKYINRSTVKLPATVPLNLESALVTPGMLANGPDPLNPPQIPGGVGCCFWADQLRAAVAKKNSAGAAMDLTLPWAVASVLAGYASTGFDINNPDATDNGTSPDEGFSYMQSTGIQLQDGTFAKLGVPVEVDPNDFEMVIIAHRLFGGLHVGVNFPADWEDADVWDATTSSIEGGHEIPTLSDVNITPEGIAIDTWGTIRIITPAGLAQQCDQLTVAIDPDFFGSNGNAINGFDAEQLLADEALVKAA